MSGRVRHILLAPVRLWRRRGFGVHSPFAFRFLTDVVRDEHHYVYYAYPAVKTICQRHEMRYDHGWLFYRLLVFCNCGELHTAPGSVFSEIGAIYTPATSPDDRLSAPHAAAGAVWVADTPDAPLPAPDFTPSRGLTCIVWPDLRDSHMRQRYLTLTDAMAHALTFTNGHRAITIISSTLTKATYRIWM